MHDPDPVDPYDDDNDVATEPEEAVDPDAGDDILSPGEAARLNDDLGGAL